METSPPAYPFAFPTDSRTELLVSSPVGSEFLELIRKAMLGALANPRSFASFVVGYSSVTGFAAVTVRRIFLGRAIPYQKTFDRLLALSRLDTADREALRTAYDAVKSRRPRGKPSLRSS